MTVSEDFTGSDGQVRGGFSSFSFPFFFFLFSSAEDLCRRRTCGHGGSLTGFEVRSLFFLFSPLLSLPPNVMHDRDRERGQTKADWPSGWAAPADDRIRRFFFSSLVAWLQPLTSDDGPRAPRIRPRRPCAAFPFFPSFFSPSFPPGQRAMRY